MGKSVEIIAAMNPFYYYLELVRAPLLGQPVDHRIWLVALSMTAVSCSEGAAAAAWTAMVTAL
jgi:ABC-type polysaccharide/polyol phosphate export permease